jgi:hypothetical protein
MPAIHLIKKINNGHPAIKKMSGEPNTYTSGFWELSEETAQAFIGGEIYFHEHQRDPSYYGGKILAADGTLDGEYQGKIVFKFVYSAECRDVKTSADRWSQEMKLSYDDR